MKRIIYTITALALIAFVVASCGSKQAAAPTINPADTAGLSQFQAWKAMNERVDPMQYASNNVTTAAPAKTVTKKVITSSSTHTAQVSQKKGWSKAAKYSAIGGGTGIALGAIIDKKNRFRGGAIGGVVLGGIGYLFGRSQDKKDGRY